MIEIPNLKQRLREDAGELRELIARLLQKVLHYPEQELLDELENRIRSCVPDDYAWPGNVRELEQCIRRICLTNQYELDPKTAPQAGEGVAEQFLAGDFTAQTLLQTYCRHLYVKYQSYEAVARKLQLDRRTVRKYVVKS